MLEAAGAPMRDQVPLARATFCRLAYKPLKENGFLLPDECWFKGTASVWR